MKKVLFTASVDGHIRSFHIPYLKLFKDNGFDVHVASDGSNKLDYVDNKFNICFERSPFNKSNIHAYKQLKKIINENNYNIIHCHTPVASILTRLAVRKARKKGTKVIYTAHGFHFYKGAPLINWLIYYPAEWICSFFTDVLITINQEDYRLAKKRMRTKIVEYIPGVGIDTDKFGKLQIDKKTKRKELGLLSNAVVILSVGELNKNKNHEVIIKAVAKLNNPNLFYLICGQGPLKGYLNELIVSLRVENQVKLMGFRNDIAEVCAVSDIFAFPSIREGLSASLMEAMAAGLPVVCSKIRGNEDLIENGKGGYLVEVKNIDEFAAKLNNLTDNIQLRKAMGEHNKIAVKKYDIKNVRRIMENIYKQSSQEGCSDAV